MAVYLIDANLPRWLSFWKGEDYVFVHDIGPTWKDSEIWAYARANGYTIVSKDADFSNLALVDRAGPKVIHVRIGNLSLNELHSLLLRNWASICDASRQARLVHVYRDRIETIA